MKLLQAAALISLMSTTVHAGNLPDLEEPAETAGISAEVIHQNDLAAQVPNMAGYDIRGRVITFEPGASVAKHNHEARPGIVYVLSGELVENRNGESKLFKAGDSWIETADTEHWVRNISDETAVILAVDTPEQE